MFKIHYHNPFEKEGETDASGLMFHMTPDIRTYDAQVLNLGQMYLDLPPGNVFKLGNTFKGSLKKLNFDNYLKYICIN